MPEVMAEYKKLVESNIALSIGLLLTAKKNKYVSKELKIKKYKKQINDYFERKYRYEFQKSILKDRNSYSLRQIMMRHL